MFIEAAVIGVIVGYLRGGRLKGLKELAIKGIWAVFIASLLQFGLGWSKMSIGWMQYTVHILSYLLLFYFIALNFKQWGMRVIGAGILLNFVVIALNQGVMPVSTEGMSPEFIVGLEAVGDGIHGLLTQSTRLPVLADTIKVSSPITATGGWYSIGDVIMDIGIVILISANMKSNASYYKVTSVKG